MDLTSSLYCLQTTQSGRTFVAGTLLGNLVPADSGPTSPRTVRGPGSVSADTASSRPRRGVGSTAPRPHNRYGSRTARTPVARPLHSPRRTTFLGRASRPNSVLRSAPRTRRRGHPAPALAGLQSRAASTIEIHSAFGNPPASSMICRIVFTRSSPTAAPRHTGRTLPVRCFLCTAPDDRGSASPGTVLSLAHAAKVHDRVLRRRRSSSSHRLQTHNLP